MSVPPDADAPDDKSGGGKPLIQVSATDVFGFGKASETLTNVLKAGVGAAFEPLMRRWLARSDQSTAREWLRLTYQAGLPPERLELTTVAGRADLRLLAERERQQHNRDVIAIEAVEEVRVLIEEGVKPTAAEVEPEWISRFWRLAQDISSEDLQSLWARVAARQSLGASKIAPRTLEALSLLTREEMQDLTRLAPFCAATIFQGGWEGGFVSEFGWTPIEPSGWFSRERSAELASTIRRLVGPVPSHHLASIGLAIPGGFSLGFNLPEDEDVFYTIAGKRFEVRGHTTSGPAVLGSGTPLSETGRQIIDLIRTEPNEAYADALTEMVALQTRRLRRA